MTATDLLLLLGFTAAAAAVTWMTIWLVGFVTGWRELARRYPARPIGPDARRGRGATLWLGGSGYSRCVSWAADDEFLHLRLWPILATAGHAPLSIPWAAIELAGSTRTGMVRGLIDGSVRCRLPRRMVERELAVREVMEPAAVERMGPRAASTPERPDPKPLSG